MAKKSVTYLLKNKKRRSQNFVFGVEINIFAFLSTLNSILC